MRKIQSFILIPGALILISHVQYAIKDHEKNELKRFVFNDSAHLLVDLKEVRKSAKYSSIMGTIDYCEEDEKAVGLGILVIIYDSIFDDAIKEGNRIWVSGRIKRIEKDRLPSTFDRVDYYAQKKIYHELILPSSEIISPVISERRGVVGYSRRLKEKLIDKIDTAFKRREAGVIKAMLIGDKSSLLNESKISFRKSGVSHVLAVSGLHVGIIYLLISQLLTFLKRMNQKFLFLTICICFIWFYAFLTGLSPSVVRASSMITLFIIAINIHKRAPIYNVLATSASFILILDPGSLFRVGFLLSYSAVIGILAIFPLLDILVNSKYWLIRKIWASVSVSVSAQLAVLPIILCQFQEVPVYFILSNLLAIPATFLIVSGSLAWLFFNSLSVSGMLTSFICFSLSFLLEKLQLFLLFISDLPVATLSLSLSLAQSLILALIITLFILGLKIARKRLILYSIFLMTILMVQSNLPSNERTLYILNMRNNPVIGKVKHGDHSIFALKQKNDSVKADLRMNRIISGLAYGKAQFNHLEPDSVGNLLCQLEFDSLNILWLYIENDLIKLNIGKKEYDLILVGGKLNASLMEEAGFSSDNIYTYNMHQDQKLSFDSFKKDGVLVESLRYNDFIELALTYP